MTTLEVLVRAACGRGDALAWLALADAAEEAGGSVPWHDARTGLRGEVPAAAFRLVGGIAARPGGLVASLAVEEECLLICRCRTDLRGLVRVVPCLESACRDGAMPARRRTRRAGLRVVPGAAWAEGGTVVHLGEPLADDVPIVAGCAVLAWVEPVAYSPSPRSLELHAHSLDVPALVLGRRWVGGTDG